MWEPVYTALFFVLSGASDSYSKLQLLCGTFTLFDFCNWFRQMNKQQNPLFWSFPLGYWFNTEIRVSWFFPLIAISFALRLGTSLGLAVAGILFVSILAHELAGHILAVRLTGGDGDEVLIWPLGGLASVYPADTFVSRFFTALGGPLVNLAICVATLPSAIWMHGKIIGGVQINAFYPFALPVAELSGEIGIQLLLLTFSINWMLLLLNLLPVYPLDGGQMVQAILRRQMSDLDSRRICIRVGIVIAVIMMFASWVWIQTLAMIMILATLILVLNSMESIQLQYRDVYDDSFMGYDFSQGYTSLSIDDDEREVKPGFFERRRIQRQEKQEEKDKIEQVEMEYDLDHLLDKVHKNGMSSLTETEKQRLKYVSMKMQDRLKSK